jgi:tRNA pseudouridine38-40 synthase
MTRYFLEVAYRGTNYSGFQSQENANTIQQEVEKAFRVLQRESVSLTGSSRTDAGVHALQNFFHFDFDQSLHPQFIYKINAILPGDIVVKSVREVAGDAHCRFDAISRTYEYFIYRAKDPFLEDRAWYFPYTIDQDALQHAARVIMEYHDFTSFSKRNTQVKTFDCVIMESAWAQRKDGLVYRVRANRFLRGMVRALVATMLQVGRGALTIDQFRAVIDAKDCTRASFAAPSHGLFLVEVCY